MISVDCSLSSPLEWSFVHETKEPILWHLQWESEVADEAQWLSLELAIEAFKEKLLLPNLSSTQGVLLWRGDLQLIQNELFTNNLCLLAARMPEGVRLSLEVEGGEPFSLEVLELLVPLAGVFAIEVVGWGSLEGSSREGVALPKRVIDREGWSRFLEGARGMRFFSEEHCTHAWEGLDSIYTESLALTAQGRRALEGFRAAGGEIMELPLIEHPSAGAS